MTGLNFTFWLVFNLFVLFMIGIDIAVFNREPHEIHTREALGWSIFWISLALIFNYGVYHFYGPQLALEFFTSYLLEKSLSIDNLFVFILIFNLFHVKPKYQQSVLLWGVIGAIIMRSIMIILGGTLIHHFHWILYLFGVFLLYTGIKMLFFRHDEHPEQNPVVVWLQRRFPVTQMFHGNKFFVKQNGRRLATPLLIVLITIEVSDVFFAVDSIPAIFAISENIMVVYTSNIFAILGLRALYFLLADVLDMFEYLQHGLAIILAFIGVKLLVSGFFVVSILFSLLFIFAVLVLAILLSVIKAKSGEVREQ